MSVKRSRRAARLWSVIAVAAVVCAASITTVTTAAANPALAPRAVSDAFVTRQGDQLMLGGRGFRFSGPNIYWLGIAENPSPVHYPSQFEVNDAFATATEMGATVVRAQTLGMSVGCSLCIEPSLGTFNETALEHIDYAVAQAHTYGLRLIIPLVDDPGQCYYLGCGKTFTNWFGLPEGDFYTNSSVISAFEQYVSHLLEHVNVYTGVALKDDPTILAWETGNELLDSWSGESTWTSQIAAFLKQTDSQHLVMDGTYGISSANLGDPNIDIYSDHFYPMSDSRLSADAAQVVNAGRPMVAGEYDWANHDGGDTLASFRGTLAQTAGVAGDDFWSLFPHSPNYGYIQHGDGYTLHYPGDTADMRTRAQELRTHAYTMSNVAPPAHGLAGQPLITSLQSDQIAWRGAALGYQYTIERSVSGSSGPWVAIASDITDNNAPWPLTSQQSGTDWYRIQADNIDGVPGAWSPVASVTV